MDVPCIASVSDAAVDYQVRISIIREKRKIGCESGKEKREGEGGREGEDGVWRWDV